MELSIALEKACYFPGELLKCLIKVRRLPSDPGSSAPAASTAAAAAVATAAPPAAGAASGAGAAAAAADVLELFFECSGAERVDPSWVGHLYHPEVTAQKDNKRLVRSIFSTGQVPLLEAAHNQALGSGREFIVRCRLPNRVPPSYRGNAVRFVYQVMVQGRLVGAAGSSGIATAGHQQQQQHFARCEAHCSFVVWPMPDRSGIERRPSLPMGPGPVSGQGVAGAAGPAAGAGGTAGGGSNAAAAAAAAAASGLLEGLQDVELIEYKLGMQALKLRWEEVVVNPDNTRTLLAHQPAAALYPSSSTASQLSTLTAAQMCALDSLQVEDQQLRVATAAASGPGDEADPDAGDHGPLRQLTSAQRSSMNVRAFNLKAGEHPLLRLMLQPPTDGLLQPGGTFGLLLDFRASHGAHVQAAAGNTQQPVCLQVVALLESEEVVLPPYAPARATQGITAMRKLYSEQQQVTAHLLTSQFMFSIPLTAPPSFKTPMVCHKWALRFELTLGKPKANRPTELVTEQLLWSLPLVVFPPPAQRSLGL